jgi:phage head maturation protease
MPDEIAYHYIPFASKGDDSARIVSGYCSGNGNVDLDDQIVDPTWLNAELPTWLASYGNIREQHNPSRAVGKAQSVDVTHPTGPYLTTKIVDDDAWKKVKEGVYNGFSVGIKGPKIAFDGTAKNGRIVGGRLIEVSIVDRPANDAAKFVVVKRAGDREWKLGESGPVVEDLAKGDTPDTCQPCGCGPDGAMDGCTCDCAICSAAKALTADTAKRDFNAADRKRLAGGGAARPDGSYPIETAKDVANAVKDFGRAKGTAADKAHIIARAKVIGATDQLPADWPGSTQEEQKMTDQQTAPVDADVEKARTPKSDPGSSHPFKGTHNHAHDDGRGGTHTHAHLHDDDDVHDHPHLAGKDARMLTPEDRESAQAMQRSSFFAADADTTAPAAETAKAVTGFQDAAPAAPSRPAAIGDVSAILKDALQRIEALSGQTDQDKDGDIDTPANMEADGPGSAGAAPAEAIAAQRPAPTLISPETLSLTFASEADLFKAIDARVQAVIATRDTTEFITKAAIAEPLATIPDIAKLAGGLAKGLEALATKAETSAQELAAMKAAVAETQADLAKVKELAQPVKGAVFAIDKGLGIAPDRVYRDGVVPDSAKRAADAVAVLAGLSDNERRAMGAEVLADMYRARQS